MEEGITVKRYEMLLKSRTWFTALLLAGCAGGLQATAMAQTAPAVIFTNPSGDATGVPTSINSSKNVVTATAPSATFSQPMDRSTIESPRAGQQLTFTLADASGNNVPGTVAMDVTNTVATFTPLTSALFTNATYVATVNTTAANIGGVALRDRKSTRLNSSHRALPSFPTRRSSDLPPLRPLRRSRPLSSPMQRTLLRLIPRPRISVA